MSKDIIRSVPMLMDEPPITLYPTLACMLGNVNHALVLQQLRFLMGVAAKSKKYDSHFIDNKWWVYNTYQQWRDEHFPWLSTSAIRDAFKSLEDFEIVLSRQDIGNPFDKTKWYTIDFEQFIAEYMDFITEHTDSVASIQDVSVSSTEQELSCHHNTENTTENTLTEKKDSDVAKSATSGTHDDSSHDGMIALLRRLNESTEPFAANFDALLDYGWAVITDDVNPGDDCIVITDLGRKVLLRYIADDSSHDGKQLNDMQYMVLSSMPLPYHNALGDGRYQYIPELVNRGLVATKDDYGGVSYHTTDAGRKALLAERRQSQQQCRTCDNTVYDSEYCDECYGVMEQLPDCAEDTIFDGDVECSQADKVFCNSCKRDDCPERDTQQCLYCDNILELPQVICSDCRDDFDIHNNHGAFTCRVCQQVEIATVEYALHTPTGDTWCMECYNASVGNGKIKTANLSMEEFADTIYVQAPQDASDWTHNNFKTCVNCGTQQIVDSDGVCAGCLKNSKAITDCKGLDTIDSASVSQVQLSEQDAYQLAIAFVAGKVHAMDNNVCTQPNLPAIGKLVGLGLLHRPRKNSTHWKCTVDGRERCQNATQESDSVLFSAIQLQKDTIQRVAEIAAKPKAPKKAKPKRQPSTKQLELAAMNDACIAAMDIDRENITTWGKWNKASKLLIDAGATPKDIPELYKYVKAIQQKQGWEFRDNMPMATRWAIYQSDKNGKCTSNGLQLIDVPLYDESLPPTPEFDTGEPIKVLTPEELEQLEKLQSEALARVRRRGDE